MYRWTGSTERTGQCVTRICANSPDQTIILDVKSRCEVVGKHAHELADHDAHVRIIRWIEEGEHFGQSQIEIVRFRESPNHSSPAERIQSIDVATKIKQLSFYHTLCFNLVLFYFRKKYIISWRIWFCFDLEGS